MPESPLETKLGPHSPHMPAADRAAIEQAIAEAERTTGAEFVVAIAARSGRYDRAEDLFGLVFGLIGVSAAWLVFQSVEAGAWDEHNAVTMTVGLPLVLGVFAIWSILGAVLATRFAALARPFITVRQMEEEVRTRAWEAYHIFRVDRAPGAAGVLIYVSLLERRVLIATGDGIGEKLPAGAFSAARDALIADIRSNKAVGQALSGAVDRCAAVVAPVVPPRERTNSIPNTVRLLA